MYESVPAMVLGKEPFISQLFASNASPSESTREKWVVEWWQWDIALDAKDNLKQNQTANPCPRNQEGPVLFLQTRLTGKFEAYLLYS